MSSAPSFKEVEGAIYEAALALEDPAARDVFLQRSFQGDADGLAEMRRLLDSAREAASFFVEAGERRTIVASDVLAELTRSDSPLPAQPLPQSEGPGTRIGRYRLIKRIGEGGCGVVYEAEQEQPLRRRVALKVIRMGMDTEGVIARFEIERQALALMDHPNIARVLDAGATAAGRPYFVMELVDGEKITSYCDERGLGNAERLTLFIQVCQAIQHAHQKGIIHRDIKPSNILITHHDGLASPKVIDFGIAKATDAQFTGGTPFTAHDQFIGTPAYMSPEQVDMVGIDVDTRSDVYSLGVLLYELLTSRTPFDGKELMNAGISEMRRTLLEAPRPLPSQMLVTTSAESLAEIAACRHVEPNRLVSFVRGDLDWIVMKAMEKNRNRRYQTVNSLAMDVQRFLNNEAVIARPPGNLYLLGKFVRRNRIAVVSGGLVAISLVGGLGAATSLYLRERKALVEQARLGHEAEVAREEEARLRHQAQARANLSRVAILLTEGQVAEADALLREIPLISVEPSLEAANVFRSLGDWNATYGRWDQAVQCYSLLNQANRLNDPANAAAGSDLLVIGPALLEHGDTAAYAAFRQDALDRYLPVHSPIQAEHILKACLLAPAGPEITQRLKDTVSVCADAVYNGTPTPFTMSWGCFSLALYHYRLGDPAGVLKVAARGLTDREIKDACRASLYCMMSMSHRRMGEEETAASELQQARQILNTIAKSETGELKPARPFWFDWSALSILIQEAEGELRQK
jgi:serine/threonine protein kinase/tetratricopeptide (TPR) repeat protein